MSTEISILSGPTMGTRYSTRFCNKAGVDFDALRQALQTSVDRVDQQMSPWIDASVVNQINRATIGEWIKLPHETQDVIATAIEIEEQSGGAFSISVGAQVQHWGFGPETAQTKIAPSAPLPTHVCFDIETTRIRKLRPNQIDLCGIAKGYGADQLAAVMDEHGVTDYLVSIDGELRCAGSSGSGTAWRVGLEAPVIGVRRTEHVLDCHDLSLATSGGYRHLKNTDRGMVSHTICPRSGFPLAAAEVSVTVAHQNCCMADGWATAFMAMGLDAAKTTATKLGLHMLFMTHSADHPVSAGSGIFSEFRRS